MSAAVRGKPLSQVLAELPPDRSMTLGEVLGAMGSRAHGCALLLLGLPDALPLPIPSVSAILGVPLILISAHLVIAGESGALPRRLSALPLRRRLVGALRLRVAPWLRRIEALSHPRAEGLAAQQRALGAICLYLSVLLLLPIPLFNTPPAICLVLVAWGMIQRDGLFVAIGLASTAVVTGALAWVGERLLTMLEQWFS